MGLTVAIRMRLTQSMKPDIHFPNRLVAAAESGDPKRLHDAVRLFRKPKVNTSLLVSDTDGVAACDRHDSAANVLEHLGTIMGGSTSSYQCLVERDRQLQADLALGFADIQRSCDAVVGIVDTGRKMSRAKPFKGSGPFHVASEVCKFFAPQVSRLIDPLLVGSAMDISQPLQFRGGDLITILKNELKSLTSMTNRREITLSD